MIFSHRSRQCKFDQLLCVQNQRFQVQWPGSEANDSLRILAKFVSRNICNFVQLFSALLCNFLQEMFMGVTTSIIVLNDYLQ